MLLSVVIVSWNISKLLSACLESVLQNPPDGEMEIWVVDNASTDDTVEMLRSCYPQVHVIVNQNNVGFAAANNQGINQAKGEFILLLNPDTVVLPGALTTLVKYLQAHPEASACGPMLLNPDRTLQKSCYPFPTLSREFWRLFHLDRLHTYGVYRMDHWRQDEPRSVDIIQGACLIVRKSILDRIGLLDEDYFMYTEEVDLLYRIKQTGAGVFWVPAARVIHYGGQSTQQVATAMFIRLYESKLVFFRKNHGQMAAWVYKLILSLTALSRILVSPFALLLSPTRRQQQLKITSNYWNMLIALPGL